MAIGCYYWFYFSDFMLCVWWCYTEFYLFVCVSLFCGDLELFRLCHLPLTTFHLYCECIETHLSHSLSFSLMLDLLIIIIIHVQTINIIIKSMNVFYNPKVQSNQSNEVNQQSAMNAYQNKSKQFRW